MGAESYADKLRALGVSEEVISSIDPREGGNITETGDVLYLDQERRDAKVDANRPLRKNHPNGLGIKNKAVKVISKKMTADILAGKDSAGGGVGGLLEAMCLPPDKPKHKVMKKLLGFDESGYSHIHVMPLNVDVSDKHRSVIMPIDLIIQELRDADYIAIMKYCVCRTSFKCEHYPAEFGCIFMGPNGRHAVEAGAANEATVEEAIQHVLKAADMGLMGSFDYIEGEQFIWGVQQDEMNEYRMICFCCDCCCLAMNIIKGSQTDMADRCSPVGWTTVVNHDKCVGCGKCASRCPNKAITYREDGKRITNQDRCLGCGFCKLDCKFDAISIKQTQPMRESINEYHINEARIDDGREHTKAIRNHDIC